MDTTYVLPVTPNLQLHGDSLPLWLGDYDSVHEDNGQVGREFTVVDAIAASGDCFVTLATRLDKIAQGLSMDSAEQIELEHIVNDLFYLQDNWSVTAKR